MTSVCLQIVSGDFRFWTSPDTCWPDNQSVSSLALTPATNTVMRASSHAASLQVR